MCLAWCVRITKDSPLVTVYHGSWCETHEEFFCEGAWNGDFLTGDFTEAPIFMGSGGKITQDGIQFATPTHTLERLHLICLDSVITVSNSLAFLLVQATDWCDPRYKVYRDDLFSITQGLTKYKHWIPTERGNACKTRRYHFGTEHIRKRRVDIL